ncbi:hypothetical protein C8F04DRAFT_1258284 [Mycena alexandri]|uniref:Uncharacterized protein n=1 Tax=Mycena alexandri TaxID=1745969 RepID=A0AAD6T2K2_9AGAR|nr:hypothetical protein C8F04DRAFT_1258284 [Mycena alexandri]
MLFDKAHPSLRLTLALVSILRLTRAESVRCGVTTDCDLAMSCCDNQSNSTTPMCLPLGRENDTCDNAGTACDRCAPGLECGTDGFCAPISDTSVATHAEAAVGGAAGTTDGKPPAGAPGGIIAGVGAFLKALLRAA